MDFTQFNAFSKDVQKDIAMCALTKILTGQMTKHLIIMEHKNKDIGTFITAHGPLITEIAKSAEDVIEALRTAVGK